MPINEKGLFTTTTLDEQGRSIFGKVDERGLFVFNVTETPPTGGIIDAGTFIISADGSLTSIGSLILNGESIFDAVSSLTIEAEVITPDIPINLSANGSLSVEASIVYNGVVSLSADTSLDVVSNLIVNAISSFNASGSLTVEGISFDPSKQIITKIQLNGVRELTVKSEGQRELTYQVTTTRNLITRLEGES